MEKRAKITLSAPAVLTMPLRDAERLTKAANGFDALLYIFILQSGGELDEAAAARALRVSPSEISASAGRLAALGLLSGPAGGEAALEPAQELPEVSAEDIVRRTADSADFQALVAETQRVYGRLLSTSELKTLFGFYDYLALPPEVIMLLIHHCAEQYIAEQERRAARLTEAARAVGIRDRAPTGTERRYLEDWLALGFDLPALEEAMERTVTNTGALKWRYMDGIVRSWDSKGLHTLREIDAGDKKPARAPAESAQGPTAEEFERMKKLREKVRKG